MSLAEVPPPPTPPLTPEQTQLLVQGMEVLERTARYFASRYGDIHSRDDFKSLGYLRLDRAVRLYDSKKGPFEPYAWQAIHGAMAKAAGTQIRTHKRTYDAGNRAVIGLRDESNSLRDGMEQNQEHVDQFTGAILIGMVLGTLGKATGETSRGEDYANKQADSRRFTSKLPDALSALSPEKQALVDLYYFGGDGDGDDDDTDDDGDGDKTPTLREIGEVLGVSYATARRRHQDLLEELRKALLTPIPASSPQK